MSQLNRYIDIYSNMTDELVCRIKINLTLNSIRNIFTINNITIGDDFFLLEQYELNNGALEHLNIDNFDFNAYSAFLSTE